tara:strand:+ start:180 stop:1172 length:993 start_codon:yes stop_codon:yes gene_type:complete
MPKLINLHHPYELSFIKDANSFLLFAKNALRIISKKGCHIKRDGILLPVRWSISKQTWVVDRGTDLQRDIVGIDLDNIDQFIKKDNPLYKASRVVLEDLKHNSKFKELSKSIRLDKNTTKFVAFEYVSAESVYPIGIYQRPKTKKRKGTETKVNSYSLLIDDSNTILDEISSTSIIFKSQKRVKLNRSYHDAYKDFKSQITNKTFSFNLKDGLSKVQIDLSREIDVNVCFNKNKNINKHTRNALRTKQTKNMYISEQEKKDITILTLCVELGEFIKQELDIKEFEGIVFDDGKYLIKITGEKLLEDKISYNTIKPLSNNDNSYPLLPGVF